MSSNTTYKTFARLIPPDDEIAPGVVDLMVALGWKHLAIITEEHELFTLVGIHVCTYTYVCMSHTTHIILFIFVAFYVYSMYLYEITVN